MSPVPEMATPAFRPASRWLPVSPPIAHRVRSYGNRAQRDYLQVLRPGLPLQLFEQQSLFAEHDVPAALQVGGGGGLPPTVELGGRLPPRSAMTAVIGTPRLLHGPQWCSETTA